MLFLWNILWDGQLRMKNNLTFETKRLGRALLAARQRIGFSLGQLSQLSGLSPSLILRIESGEYDCRLQTLTKLCGPLAIRPGALFEFCLGVQFAFAEAAERELEDSGQSMKILPRCDPIKWKICLDLISESCRVTSLMVRISDPRKFAAALLFAIEQQRDQFQIFAQEIAAAGISIDNRLEIIHHLQIQPIKKLQLLKLLNHDIIESFISWAGQRKGRTWKAIPAATSDEAILELL